MEIPQSGGHHSTTWFEIPPSSYNQEYKKMLLKLQPPRLANSASQYPEIWKLEVESGPHTFSCLLILLARENSSRRQLLPHVCLPSLIHVQLLGYLTCFQTLYARECEEGCFQLSIISKLNEAGLEFGRTKSNVYDKLL